MNTHTCTQKKAVKNFSVFGLFMILILAANPLMAQTERTVKGVVTDEVGPIEGATVILKGTNIYVYTDQKGRFTFPQKLTENDALSVIQLGYKNKDIRIGANTSFVNILMSDYDIVIVGALMMGDNNSASKGQNPK